MSGVWDMFIGTAREISPEQVAQQQRNAAAFKTLEGVVVEPKSQIDIPAIDATYADYLQAQGWICISPDEQP